MDIEKLISVKDKNGNEIYANYSDGFEIWKEYDEYGITHYKDSTGVEKWMKYDENSNLIYSKDSRCETWIEYDEDGKIIHYKNSRSI